MWRTLKALLHVGGNISVLESVAAYLLPLGFLLAPTALQELFVHNLKCQLALFLLMVQLPLAVTGKMAYVDLG
jgi:hypothetical protein